MKIDQLALENARKQFCLDIDMSWELYQNKPDQKVYIQCMNYHKERAGARLIDRGDDFLRAVICMGQLFLLTDEQIYEWALKEFSRCSPEWFCSYSNLRRIDQKLKEFGREIKDTHIYYLPAENADTVSLNKPLQWFDREDILKWKGSNRFPHAVCYSKTQPDMLAVAAMKEGYNAFDKDFDQNHMAGMAGVSRDGEYLWQIGIDVEQANRGGGLATGLVMLMKEEVKRQGKTPFYGTSESHTISQSVAYHAGFMPAWTEIYVQKVLI